MKRIVAYSESQLKVQLRELPPRCRTIFALACAQRLLPTYEHFTRRTREGDLPLVTAAINRLWLDVEGQLLSPRELQANLDSVMALIPEECTSLEAAAADALSCLSYAICCRRTGSAQEAAWAARRAYEALDGLVIAQQRIELNVAGAEERALSHPSIQAELIRQQRDLRELRAAVREEPEGLISRFRDRATSDSKLFWTWEWAFAPDERS